MSPSLTELLLQNPALLPGRGAAEAPRLPRQASLRVVAIASSAGGVGALLEVLAPLPADFPAAVVVAQHRLRTGVSLLTPLLAKRLRLRVCEPGDYDRLRPGTVYVAPAGRHTKVESSGAIRVVDGPPVNFAYPSADVLFRSLASLGERAVGVVLTGMGRDGAMGTRAIRAAGGLVIAQDEGSSAFPAMPTAATDLGRVDLVLPLHRISAALLQLGAEADAA